MFFVAIKQRMCKIERSDHSATWTRYVGECSKNLWPALRIREKHLLPNALYGLWHRWLLQAPPTNGAIKFYVARHLIICSARCARVSCVCVPKPSKLHIAGKRDTVSISVACVFISGDHQQRIQYAHTHTQTIFFGSHSNKVLNKWANFNTVEKSRDRQIVSTLLPPSGEPERKKDEERRFVHRKNMIWIACFWTLYAIFIDRPCVA